MKYSLLAICFLFVAHAQAGMYSWTDASGKKHYSDQPPPTIVKQASKRNTNASRHGALSYALNQAVRKNPVTIYTSSTCAPCQEARIYLKARGIPFAEKTVESAEDFNYLRRRSGDNRLPFLEVGRQKEIGFDEPKWEMVLKHAQYPDDNQLPASYRYPPKQSAAPYAATGAPAKKSIAKPNSSTRLPVEGNAPKDFRF